MQYFFLFLFLSTSSISIGQEAETIFARIERYKNEGKEDSLALIESKIVDAIITKGYPYVIKGLSRKGIRCYDIENRQRFRTLHNDYTIYIKGKKDFSNYIITTQFGETMLLANRYIKVDYPLTLIDKKEYRNQTTHKDLYTKESILLEELLASTKQESDQTEYYIHIYENNTWSVDEVKRKKENELSVIQLNKDGSWVKVDSAVHNLETIKSGNASPNLKDLPEDSHVSLPIAINNQCKNFISYSYNEKEDKYSYFSKEQIVCTDRNIMVDFLQIGETTFIDFIFQSKELGCISEGAKVNLHFADGSKHTLYTKNEDECEGKITLFMGEVWGNNSTLSILNNTALTHLSFQTKLEDVFISFSESESEKIKQTLSCLLND